MRAGGTALTNGSVVASNSWTTRSKGKKTACHSSNLDTFFPTIADQYVSGDGTMVERDWGRGGRVSRTRERVGKQKCWKAVSHQDECAVHGKNC